MKTSLLLHLSILLFVGQINGHALKLLFRDKTIRDGLVDMIANFQDMVFDWVDEGFQTNPKLYAEMKEPLATIRETVITNMRFINEFTISSALWMAKEGFGYMGEIWEEHGRNILNGQYDHEMAYNLTLHYLEETEKFIAVKGLGLNKVLDKVLGKNKRMRNRKVERNEA